MSETDRHPNRGYAGWTRRRDDPLAQGNQAHPPKAKKKNTRKWCHGKTGVEHFPVMAMSSYATTWQCRPGRTVPWRKSTLDWSTLDWQCWHRVLCAKCGKVLDHFPPPQDCPDLPEEMKEKIHEGA